jgi:hypothetical protein
MRNLLAENRIDPAVPRRRFVGGALALVTSLLAGCTGLRAALKAYPDRYDTDEELIERTLRTFMTTIVPVAAGDEPNLVRIFSDPSLPFHEHRGFFVYELSKRSRRLHGAAELDRLELRQRTQVVSSAQEEGGVVEKLYCAAILLGQASFYGGIYDDGCDYLDFPGPNRGFPDEVLYHKNAEAYLAPEATRDGNHS